MAETAVDAKCRHLFAPVAEAALLSGFAWVVWPFLLWFKWLPSSEKIIKKISTFLQAMVLGADCWWLVAGGVSIVLEPIAVATFACMMAGWDTHRAAYERQLDLEGYGWPNDGTDSKEEMLYWVACRRIVDRLNATSLVKPFIRHEFEDRAVALLLDLVSEWHEKVSGRINIDRIASWNEDDIRSSSCLNLYHLETVNLCSEVLGNEQLRSLLNPNGVRSMQITQVQVTVLTILVCVEDMRRNYYGPECFEETAIEWWEKALKDSRLFVSIMKARDTTMLAPFIRLTEDRDFAKRFKKSLFEEDLSSDASPDAREFKIVCDSAFELLKDEEKKHLRYVFSLLGMSAEGALNRAPTLNWIDLRLMRSFVRITFPWVNLLTALVYVACAAVVGFEKRSAGAALQWLRAALGAASTAAMQVAARGKVDPIATVQPAARGKVLDMRKIRFLVVISGSIGLHVVLAVFDPTKGYLRWRGVMWATVWLTWLVPMIEHECLKTFSYCTTVVAYLTVVVRLVDSMAGVFVVIKQALY